jgi:hypothetical protein
MQFNSVITYEADHSAPIEIPDESPTAATIRRTHASTEASIKALGVLCLLVVVLGALRLAGSIAKMDTSSTAMQSILFAAAWLVVAARCGTWLRALDPRGRLLYTLLFIIDLGVFAYQTFQAHALLTMLRETFAMAATSQVSLHEHFQVQLALGLAALIVRLAFMCFLWNRQGRMVMSRHYRHTIIPATPDITHRSRVPLLFLLALLLSIAVMAGVGIVMA